MSAGEIYFKIGTRVATPNGPGWFEGVMLSDGDETQAANRVLVRHKFAEMTGREAGICITPGAKTIGGLWLYEPEQVTAGK